MTGAGTIQGVAQGPWYFTSAGLISYVECLE